MAYGQALKDRVLLLYDEGKKTKEIAERLKASGRLYACYETPEELSLKRKLQLQHGAPPVYDRAALARPAEIRCLVTQCR